MTLNTVVRGLDKSRTTYQLKPSHQPLHTYIHSIITYQYWEWFLQQIEIQSGRKLIPGLTTVRDGVLRILKAKDFANLFHTRDPTMPGK